MYLTANLLQGLKIGTVLETISKTLSSISTNFVLIETISCVCVCVYINGLYVCVQYMYISVRIHIVCVYHSHEHCLQRVVHDNQ